MSLVEVRRPRDFKWWAICLLLSLIVGALGAGVVALVVAHETHTYESQATLAIDQPIAIALSPSADGITKLSALRVKYTGIATTYEYAELVAKHSGLPVGDIAGRIVSVAPAGNLLFTVGAVGTDPIQTRRVAAAAAATMSVYVRQNQAGLRIAKKLQVQVKVVTPALAAVKISPTRTKELGATALAGIVLFALALSVQTLRLRQPTDLS